MGPLYLPKDKPKQTTPSQTKQATQKVTTTNNQ